MIISVATYIDNKTYIEITGVTEPVEICFVKKDDSGNLKKITAPMALDSNRLIGCPWPVAHIVEPGKEIKLLCARDSKYELIDIDVSNLLKGLQPMQADIAKELPTSIQRIAACTICYNEDFIIKKWVQHYGGLLGYENLYVIDDGSNTPVAELLSGLPVNITRIPRTSFDSWRLVRTLGYMQRVLLETYDLVITLDSDEFVVCTDDDPDMDLAAYLRTLNPADMVNVAPVGFDLVHSRSREQDIDSERPVVEQRKYVMRSLHFDKPVFSSVPTSFKPGLHEAYCPKRVDPNLVLLHLRNFDFNFAVDKLQRYKSTAWSAHDLKTGLAFHQRWKLKELEAEFDKYETLINEIGEQKSMMKLASDEAGLLDEAVRRKFLI